MDDFSSITGENIKFSQERIPVYWCEFSTVEATLTLIHYALAEKHHFDYLALLSGTDYPLQTASYIEKFFTNSSSQGFINMVKMPCNAVGKPITRLTTYAPSSGKSKISKGFRRLLLAARVLLRNRDFKSHLGSLTPYGGSTWWVLSYDACEYIQNFVNNEPKIVHFFKNTICPCESFFQTILGNSPYKEKVQRNLTFTDWRGGGKHPEYITETHLEFLATTTVICDDAYGRGEILFARKFSDNAKEVVLRLDQIIVEKNIT